MSLDGLAVPSLQALIAPIVIVLVASVLVIAFAASAGASTVTAFAAAAFLIAIAASAVYINLPLWRPTPAGTAAALLTGALRRNARLAALVYVWGSAVMFSVYMLAGLKWQHGWQYGTLMALIAGVHLWFVHDMGNAASWLRTVKGQDFGRWLGVVHGVAAVVGLGFLIGSGKLLLSKPDWVANQVFLAGLLAIIVVCALGAVTQYRLAQRR